MSDTKTKEEYVVEFIKALKAVEDEMEPYMEHRRDLKKKTMLRMVACRKMRCALLSRHIV